MTSLNRAVALKQVHNIALGISEDLNFDMARLSQVTFQQYIIVTKRGARLTLDGLKGSAKFSGRLNHTHPFAAATGASFDQLRVADFF